MPDSRPQALATEQGTVVRALKKAKADKKEIATAVAELKKRKEAVEVLLAWA